MSIAPRPPVTLFTVFRRCALWTIICSISAVPSFVIARSELKANVAGMAVGVGLFVLFYTAVTSTARFERLYRRPFVRETMYVGYGLRVVLSSLVLLSAAGASVAIIIPDFWCGIASVLASSACGLEVGSSAGSPKAEGLLPFYAALLTTCIQGALLNVIVFIVMFIAYFLQRLFRRRPQEFAARGFEVIASDAVGATLASPVADRSSP